MREPETYDVYAIRYCSRSDRRRSETFISNTWTDPVHDTNMPIAYFIWAIVNENRSIVVDTGFDRKESDRRRDESGGVWQPEFACSPAEGLARLGINAAKVEDVIVTHLHFDHAGTMDDFPAARFHLQAAEMSYATGPHMCNSYFQGAYTADHVANMVKKVYSGNVQFHEGDDEIAPGITVHHIGGHTMGIQCVRVLTKRGWVVLASDASHFYENMETMAPFPIVYNVGDMLRGFEKMRRLAPSRQHIVPGHDPLVMARYPAPSAEHQDLIVRLDVDPTA